MKTTFSFLRGLMLLAAVSLCAAQAGAQSFWYKQYVNELYRDGWLGTWLGQKDVEKNIIAVYKAHLDKNNTTMTEQEKAAEAQKQMEGYRTEQMMEDMTKRAMPVIQQAVPEEEELRALVDWLKDDDSMIPYKVIDSKLGESKNLEQAYTEVITKKLTTILEGERAKKISPLPCTPEYKAAFDKLYGEDKMKELNDMLKQQTNTPEMRLFVRMLPNGEWRMEKALKYMQENIPVMLLNTLIEKGITEKDLQALMRPEYLCFQRLSEAVEAINNRDFQVEMAGTKFIDWYNKYQTKGVLDKPENYNKMVAELFRSEAGFDNVLESMRTSITPVTENILQKVRRNVPAKTRKAQAATLVDKYLKEQATYDMAAAFTPHLQQQDINGNMLSRYVSMLGRPALKVAMEHEAAIAKDSTVKKLMMQAYEQHEAGNPMEAMHPTACTDSYKRLFDLYYEVSGRKEAANQINNLAVTMGSLSQLAELGGELSEEDKKEMEEAKQAMAFCEKYMKDNWYALSLNLYAKHVTEEDLQVMLEVGGSPLTASVRKATQGLIQNSLATGLNIMGSYVNWLKGQL
ncbi:MAG: hypothetical protein J6K41_02175 [Paraprevotella sp.]|nr:hypothetical protein [Paraprevotella sp.]